jgi:hypothetical protein
MKTRLVTASLFLFYSTFGVECGISIRGDSEESQDPAAARRDPLLLFCLPSEVPHVPGQ